MAPKTPPKAQLGAYTVLALALPAAAPAFPRPATHYLYVRPHAPKAAAAHADTPRSLFAANLPVDATAAALRTLFKEQLGGGLVARVEFEGARGSADADADADADAAAAAGAETAGELGRKRKRRDEEGTVRGAELPRTWGREVRGSGSCGVVVFVDRASMEGALRECRRAARQGRRVEWRGGEGLGVERYHTHHTLRYPSKPALRSSVNAFLTAFARQEGSRARLLARQRSVPDADGFVAVTRGGRAGPARPEEAQAAAERARRRDRGRVGEDFYRFQVRERRKEREREVRRGFEEDVKRVEEMRRSRGRVRPE